MANDFLKQTLDHYRQQLAKKREEMRPLELMIRQLERELGESSSGQDSRDLDSSLTLGDALNFSDSFTVSPNSRGSADVRPDEFFGMSQSEATKVYLKKIGRAVSLDDIVTALNKGGAKVGGANPKKTLYVSLMRNPLREFVSPSENHIGLRVFYPGLPKTEKTKSQKTKKKSKSTKKTVKAAAKKPVVKKEKESSSDGPNIGQVVRQILSDGIARTKDEIVKEAETKIGEVSKIAVFGTLRSKHFAETEGKFRLAN